MNVVLEVKGIDKLVKNLAKTRKNIGKKTTQGLVKAGDFIMRESLKIVPVQIGHMKGSWFVRKVNPKHIEVGYESKDYNYFALVHEMPNIPPHGPAHGQEFNVKHAAEIRAAAGTWRGTAEGGMFKRGYNQQYKFLEKPIRDNHDKILKIIRNEIIKII